ncbi:hypothetical protein MMC22_000851 [Lobaria immixta]|nr:hypothetical protein [Lobaria immixta]
MPSSQDAALRHPIATTPGEDRNLGYPRHSPAVLPPFSPIAPTYSPVTPTISEEQQKDELLAQLRHENGVLMAKNRVLLQHIRTIVPDLKLQHLGSPGELRWLTGGDAGRFCVSPDGNARNFDGEQYLEQVLQEAEIERKFSEDWRAEMEAGDERRYVIERPSEKGGVLDREAMGLPDQFPEGARRHEEGKAIVARPMAAPVAASVTNPVATIQAVGKKRKRGNAGEGVATRKQTKRACKVGRVHKK